MNPTLAFLLAARRSEIHGLEQLRATSELVRGMSEWVHRLQRERGASNLFIASRGQRFAAERQQCVDDSQQVEQAVRARHFAAVEDPSAVYGGVRLLSRIAQLLQALDGLPQLRRRVALRELSAAQAAEAYTALIAALLAVVFEAADTAADPRISRALVALFHLMQGKELAGQERAAGTAAFAAGSVDAQALQRLQHLVEGQERCFQVVQDFAEPMLCTMWQHLQAGEASRAVEQLRAGLRAEGPVRDGAAGGEHWFAATTRRIDAMRLVEDAATSALVALCEARLAEVREAPATPQAAPAPQGAPDLLGPHLGRSLMDLVQEQACRLQRMSDELASAQGALRERKLVERAKGLLMERRGLGEEAAYRLLRQTAMQRHRRLGEVAEAVLQMGPLIDGL
ncbi:nitrate- and nitrite sensing domain-containing protein [Piscinibacter sakaiensis]|uniref:Response regulator NasT n=1 Tax=Piscinibacter sakaiensis TaxID=1547922 RepID=A0A0K8P2K8_PISS1|nr:nitrate regulatory protein [Piscinibacter sakaiensis]GAP36769.1 response regulator NasT [Piscinibacter sakaiensis]